MVRDRGVATLEPGVTFTHLDLLAAAEAQGTQIAKRGVLVVRTGGMGEFYRSDGKDLNADWNKSKTHLLIYSPELVACFREQEIPHLVTDLIANEATHHPGTRLELPLHCTMTRNLGVAFT